MLEKQEWYLVMSAIKRKLHGSLICMVNSSFPSELSLVLQPSMNLSLQLSITRTSDLNEIWNLVLYAHLSFSSVDFFQ